MRSVMTIVCMILFISGYAFPQFDVLEKVKKKAEEKVKEETDKTIDDALEGDEKTEEDSVKKVEATDESKPSSTENVSSSRELKSYSKFDFVPGEKIIGFEDFMTGSIGDFPAGWNTNGSAEIVTVEGKPGRWLMITKPGVFVPEFTDKLPADFTFEFDLLHSIPFQSGNSVALFFSLTQLSNTDQPQNWGVANNRYSITLLPGSTMGYSSSERRKNSTGEAAISNETKQLTDQFNPAHVSIWRQKERVRVYINEEKVWDVPKALSPDAELNSLVFFLKYAEPTSVYYVGNLRLAVGAPDTRSKFLTEGKWVTHGILFDVNSANIKAESYGTLKEIANVLKENADVKVKIVGHTDSDGDENKNLDLSKRRAESVKNTLTKEFGINESRMETDGMGETKPVSKNDTPAGKANNRRVEFIKK